MFQCPSCPCVCFTEHSIRQHQLNTGHAACWYCDLVFPTESEALKHQHDLPCPDCARICYKEHGLRQHQLGTGHAACLDCNLTFRSLSGARAHELSTHRFPCTTCGAVSRSRGALNDHQRATGHELITGFQCCDCDRYFDSDEALDQHLETTSHCRQAPQALEKHLETRSRCHQAPQALHPSHHGSSLIACPAGHRCSRVFSSFSAVVQHLESGACRSGINRRDIATLVKYIDTQGFILKETSGNSPFNVLETTLQRTYDSDRSLSTVSGNTSSALWSSSPSTYQPTIHDSALYNSNTCPRCFRQFKNSNGLNQHMASPVHDPRIYSCSRLPVSVEPAGHRSFSTFGGLLQHLESDSCGDGKKILREGIAFGQRMTARLQDRYPLRSRQTSVSRQLVPVVSEDVDQMYH